MRVSFFDAAIDATPPALQAVEHLGLFYVELFALTDTGLRSILERNPVCTRLIVLYWVLLGFPKLNWVSLGFYLI